MHEKQRGKVAVYDLGGTFDISILKLISTSEGDISPGAFEPMAIRTWPATINNLLQAFVHEQILQTDQIDFSPHGELAQELRKELIELKHKLSGHESATLAFVAKREGLRP